MDYTTFTIIAQSTLTLYFALTHWISLYPWNDLSHEAFAYERPTNILMHVIQVGSIYGFAYRIPSLMLLGLIFWSLWMIGHIAVWWIPYIFGATPEQMNERNKDTTYTFLPSYPNHPAPDACHTILGALSLIVIASVYASYFS